MNQQASFSRESIEIRFRCHAKKKSGKGLLFEFLQNDEIFTSKEMILQAIKAYWMPVAMAKTTHFSEEELEYVGLRSIQELRRQIDEIAFVTGVQLNTNMSEKEVTSEGFPLSQASENQEIAFRKNEPFADLGL